MENTVKELDRNLRKTKIGIVVSDKMDKTIVVAITNITTHAMFKKVVKITKKFKVHDEKEEAGVGDTVEIAETRPISREVRWRLVRIIDKAK